MLMIYTRRPVTVLLALAAMVTVSLLYSSNIIQNVRIIEPSYSRKLETDIKVPGIVPNHIQHHDLADVDKADQAYIDNKDLSHDEPSPILNDETDMQSTPVMTTTDSTESNTLLDETSSNNRLRDVQIPQDDPSNIITAQSQTQNTQETSTTDTTELNTPDNRVSLGSHAQDAPLRCPDLSPPRLIKEAWHVVQDNTSWVVTAHLDPRERDHTLVKVMGIMSTTLLFSKPPTPLYCQLWNPSNGTVEIVPAVPYGISPRVRYMYENFILHCAFQTGLYVYNQSVISVVAENCQQPNHSLPIHDNSRNTIPAVQYTVCVCGSMRNNYSDYQRFIEWMEINALLGVGRTIIYDTDTADYMQNIFRYYSKKGVLVSIPWIPPYVYVRKYAHLAMVHDCLMRAMLKTEYVAFIDVDETIAPREPGALTWNDMIKSAKCQGRSYISAPNTLFHPDWSSDELFANDTRVASRWRLYSLLKTKRETEFMQFEDRSKNILKPENVEHIKLHKAFLRPEIDEKPCILDPKIGALHHYRWLYTRIQRGFVEEPSWIQDRSLHKYKDPLISRVSLVYRELKDHIPDS